MAALSLMRADTIARIATLIEVYGAEELMLMSLYDSDAGGLLNRTSHDYGDSRTQISE
jgi:hypothetical protein